MNDVQNIITEAALTFSGEDGLSSNETEDLLSSYLAQTKGITDKRIWYLLLDVLYVSNNKVKFDRFSLQFANIFGSSPPPWPHNQKSIAPIGLQEEGRNILIIDGPITDTTITPQRTKEFLLAAKELRKCKLDLSRMKTDLSTFVGLDSLCNLMSSLRKQKIKATLMGEIHVCSFLHKKIKLSLQNSQPNDSSFWLLYLEILQWRGQMSEFEDISYHYTCTFDISGPGWEPDGVMIIEKIQEIEDVSAGNVIDLPEYITEYEINNIQNSINSIIMSHDHVILNFNNVKKVSFTAAGAFASILGEFKIPEKIIIQNPSDLIFYLFEIVGILDYSTVQAKKK